MHLAEYSEDLEIALKVIVVIIQYKFKDTFYTDKIIR